MKSASDEDVVYLSREDEIANSVTHGAGFLASLAVIGFVGTRTGDAELGLWLNCFAFGFFMAVLYAASTLSHMVQSKQHRHILRAWDQGLIYLFISATYSPFIWQALNGGYLLFMMLAVWGAALFGFVAKVFVGHRVNSISTLTYLFLGWFPAAVLVSKTPAICVRWMIIGGTVYSLGIVFLVNSRRFRYAHAVWHLFVMAGTAAHAWAIYQLVYPS